MDPRKPIILIDLDETLLQFNLSFGGFLRKHGLPVPEGYQPEEQYWDEEPRFKDHRDVIQGLYVYFRECGLPGMCAYPGAVDFVKGLGGWNRIYCTARGDDNEDSGIKETTYRQILDLGFPSDSIIFTRTKARLAMALGAAAAIDDNPRHLSNLSRCGCRVLAPVRSYNQSVQYGNVDYFSDYEEASEILRSIREDWLR